MGAVVSDSVNLSTFPKGCTEEGTQHAVKLLGVPSELSVNLLLARDVYIDSLEFFF